MRNWRNWLLPVLTCLAVVGLALLPLRLSTLRDREFTGAVRTEELGENSNFPARPPVLERRLWLLAQWEERPGDFTVVGQDLMEGSEELATVETAVRAELAELAELGVLPDALEGFTSFSGSRFYMRDPQDLSSAGFLTASAYEPERDVFFTLTLDSETNRILQFRMYFFQVKKYVKDPVTLGTAFLNRLGLSCEVMEAWDSAAYLRIPDSGVCYFVMTDRNQLEIVPRRDWEAEREETDAPGSTAGIAMAKWGG